MDALVQGLLKGVTAEGFEDCFKAKVPAHASLGTRSQSTVLVHVGELPNEILAQGCSWSSSMWCCSYTAAS